MEEAVVAGAIAGAVAGVIAGAAVVLASRGKPRRGPAWQAHTFSRHPSDPSHATGPSAEFANVQPSTAFLGGSLFSRFNDRAKRVIALAQDEAIRLDHNYMGTEHLLLGLLREGEGVAAQVLAASGIELGKVRSALELIVPRGEAATSPTEITLSPRTKRVIELAAVEAAKLGHSHVGTEHLLLGLVVEGQGIAAGILESLGVTPEAIRQRVIAVLAKTANPGPGGGAAAQTRVGSMDSPARGPFDRFTDRAKRVLALAQDEAIRFNHNYIGPEHVLLGVVREGEGIGGRVLKNLGAELARGRLEVESLIGRGEATTSPSEITLTPRTRKLIELAIDEARQLGHTGVSTEHFLLGMLRDDGSNAGTILKRMGVDLEKIRPYVLAMLDEGTPPRA